MKKLEAILIGTISIIAVVAIGIQPPIAQDIQYHLFADQRGFLAIPNFWNVLSNVPFLFVGIIGLYGVLISKRIRVNTDQKAAYILFFSGVAMVAVGSGYYHLWPENSSLLWDRLPMTVAFMAVFSIIISEFISNKHSKFILWSLVVFGVFSVVYWHITESQGAGDLRLYALVQFLPMLLIPIFLFLYKDKSPVVAGYWWLLLWYVIAKVLEHFDARIFDFVGAISGHSLKHIAAATGVLFLLLAYRKEKPT